LRPWLSPLFIISVIAVAVAIVSTRSADRPAKAADRSADEATKTRGDALGPAITIGHEQPLSNFHSDGVTGRNLFIRRPTRCDHSGPEGRRMDHASAAFTTNLAGVDQSPG
jgi:hypothetical protein